MTTKIVFDSIDQTEDQLDGVTITLASSPEDAIVDLGSFSDGVRVEVNGNYVRSISSSSGTYILSASDSILGGVGSVDFGIYVFDEDDNRLTSTWKLEIVEASSDSSPPPKKDSTEVQEETNQVLSDMTEALGQMSECLCSLASAVQGIRSLMADPEQGIVVRQANSEDWALQRASTISSLREAFQLENVFDEMENPTELPVKARSESQLESVEKREDAITPQGNNAADYPDINQGGNAGTPVDLDEFKTPLDRTLEEEENQEEDNTGVNPCHPL